MKESIEKTEPSIVEFTYQEGDRTQTLVTSSEYLDNQKRNQNIEEVWHSYIDTDSLKSDTETSRSLDAMDTADNQIDFDLEEDTKVVITVDYLQLDYINNSSELVGAMPKQDVHITTATEEQLKTGTYHKVEISNK